MDMYHFILVDILAKLIGLNYVCLGKPKRSSVYWEIPSVVHNSRGQQRDRKAPWSLAKWK